MWLVENKKIEKYYHKGTCIPKEKPSIIRDLFNLEKDFASNVSAHFIIKNYIQQSSIRLVFPRQQIKAIYFDFMGKAYTFEQL